MKNKIYLCKTHGSIIAALNVDEESVQLTEQIASPWELSFEIHRYILNDGLQENPYYNSISENMELYLDSENAQARFIIDAEPSISADGTVEVKNVTAHSIEAELQNKFLDNFQVNTGQEASQENLLKGNLLGDPVPSTDISQTLYDYNINPYINLPVDYITVSCRLGDELETFRDNLSPTVIKWQFEEEDTLTSIPISFDSSNGVITSSESTLLQKWYDEFTNKYPRIISDITWGIDKQSSSSTTYNSIICVTDAYIARNTSGQIYIPPPIHKYTLNSAGTAYEITTISTASFSWDNFVNGINRIISFYEKFSDQLSLIDLVLEKAKASDWSVGNIPEHIAKKKYSFSTEYQDIYSFFTNNLSHTMKVIFTFDSIHKTVNIVDLADNDLEYETGIVTGFRNLLQAVDIQTSSADGIKTTFKVHGGNDLDVTYVNFGKDKITNIDYFINKVDDYGEYQYGTKQLHDKYKQWLAYRDETKFSEEIPTYSLNINTKTLSTSAKTISDKTNRELYIELSKAYNQTIKDINELTYLVPSDGAMTDYTSYPLEDLKKYMTAYLNAYNALVELYKAEYNKTSVVESEIINTYFYQDWKIYKETIIPNVLNALRMYALTDANGNFKDSNGNTTTNFANFVYPEGGNPQYNGNAEMVTERKNESFLYDMSLYGLSELNVKKKAWAGAAAQAYKSEFVKSGTPGVNAQYRTWSEISASTTMKEKFTDKESYERLLNKYLDYMSTTVRSNGLTKTNSKGVVVIAAAEIAKCENVIKQMTNIQTQIGNLRAQLANSVTYEGWGGFTDEELIILYSLSKEAEYTNENILTTNLNNIVSEIDVQEELYEDASKRLFEKARPQYSISTTLDNIMALDEFAPMRSQIKLLNYFYLRYGLFDDETLKLRIVQIGFNPMIKTEDFRLEFSNMTFTFEGLNDLIFLFEQNQGVSSGGGSSGGSSGGTYGATDAVINLSNNMLNALLKNTTTATSLSLDNFLTTKEVDNLLVNGDLRINGAAITNVIKSLNYNGTNDGLNNTTGSILKLSDGQFNFAGGALKYTTADGLQISGYVSDDDLSSNTSTTIINGGNVTTGKIQSKNNYSWLDLDNGQFNFGNGGLTFNGTTLTVKGEMVAGAVKSQNYNGSNNDVNNTTGSIINLTNGKINFGGKIKYDGSSLTMYGNLYNENVLSAPSKSHAMFFMDGGFGLSFANSANGVILHTNSSLINDLLSLEYGWSSAQSKNVWHTTDNALNFFKNNKSFYIMTDEGICYGHTSYRSSNDWFVNFHINGVLGYIVYNADFEKKWVYGLGIYSDTLGIS